MKVIAIITVVFALGLTACQKRDTDSHQQDQSTTPHSMDQDK